MSTFKVEVVPVQMTPHPNADTLSLVQVFGFVVAVRTSDWIGIDRGAYVPVDGVVPDVPEFAFLDGHRRIKARRLRGIFSMGLLVAPRPHWQIGDDVTAEMGVTKYEPPEEPLTGSEDTAPPEGFAPCYTDIESLRRFGHVFAPGEVVVVTEKIHGANMRVTLRNGVLHVGSRTRWKSDAPGSLWWRAARCSGLAGKLADLTAGAVVYGEAFGQVQDLRYGTRQGEVRFRAFDVFDPHLNGGGYLDEATLLNCLTATGIERAPAVYRGPFDFDRLAELAEGDSLVAPQQIMEGIVVRPVRERFHPEIGRVIAKLHSQRYLLRKGA